MVPTRPGTSAAPPVEDGGEGFALYPPRTRRGLDPTRAGEFAMRLERLRKLHALLPEPRLCGAVHIFDVSRVPLRFGAEWPQLREKVWQILEHGVARSLSGEDLYVVAGPGKILAFTSGPRWRDAERTMKLAAARITERLCGLVAGGATVTVRTLPFDLLVGLVGVRDLGELERRIQEFGRALEERERRAFEEVRARLELRYRPILRLRTRLVVGHLAVAGVVEEGVFRPAESLCPDRAVGAFDAMVDRFRIEAAGHLLERSAHARRGLLLVPIHYETLVSTAVREPVIAALRRLPTPVRRRLVLHLPDLPPGLPQAGMVRLAGLVETFARALAGALALDRPELERFEGTRFRIVVPTVAPLLAEDREATATLLRRLVRAARHQRLRVAVFDVGDAAGLSLVHECGVDYVASSAFGPPLAVPLARRRLDCGRRPGGRGCTPTTAATALGAPG